MANRQYIQFTNMDAYPNIHYPLDMRNSSVIPLGSHEQSNIIEDGRYFHQQHQHSQMAPHQYDGQGVYSNFASRACRQQRQSSQQHQSQYVFENEGLEHSKMLVVLQSGEQRLISFTSPKENCTVQELLDKFGISYPPHEHIECITNPGNGCDYLVTIPQCNETPAEIVSTEVNTLQRQQEYNTAPKIIDARPQVKRKYPVPDESPPLKLVPGFLAVCPTCGICSIDHHRCVRCRTVFEENVRVISSAGSDQPSVKKPKNIPSIITTEKQKKETKYQVSFAKKKVTFADRGRGIWTNDGHSPSMQTRLIPSSKFNFNNQPSRADSGSTHLNRFVGSQFGSTIQHPTTTAYGSDSLSSYHHVGFGLNNSSSMYPHSRQTYDSMAWHRHPKSLHHTSTSSTPNSYDFNTASSSPWMRNGQEYDPILCPGGTGLSYEMNPHQTETHFNNLENISESEVDKEENEEEEEEENETPEDLIESSNVCEAEDLSCVVCQDERKNVLILPCRHLCVCGECSTKIELCPLCRKPIEELMTVFM